MALPVLDISPFLADSTSAAAAGFVRELRDACHGPGFAYITGHGVTDDANAALMDVARRFFDLPEADRMAIVNTNSPHFRGYTPLGLERTRGVSDWRDQIDVGPEDPVPVVRPDDPAWLNLRGPNQWPTALPEMSDIVLGWMARMEEVGLAVLRALALGLGHPADLFDHAATPNPDLHLKIIRYPAQDATADTGQGVGLHHDSGLLSFILQDDVGGLQVEIDGVLVDAVPTPGAFVMNLGEMLQVATGGYLRATNHRVESPPPGVERISVAFFFNPRLESTFGAVELPPELAAEAVGGQNPDPDDPIFSVFGENNLKIRLRAHPDVAAIHYADVIG